MEKLQFDTFITCEADYAYKAGKADLLRELIEIWEPREKESPLMIGVLLDQLKVRLGLLEDKNGSINI